MADPAKPELLSPAGTREAMRAAVAAGADAVYFGADAFNARANARNFTADELADAVSMLHAHGVKSHVTLNVQVFDRELSDALRCAENIYRAGADAIIVSDLGLARLLRQYFPDIELHASTQASGHSVRDAEYFASLGFSRMVCARELSASDIKTLAERSPIGIEMFIHGAICVSISGQCLFSSMVGGRSGNRGECAQPCRLPYNGGYPLSPKDMCLAGHMTEIVKLGVCSLKIEGRMKSPEYVYRTTELYRRLIDEGRDATASEIKSLSAVFSRSGFTDAYFTGSVKSDPNAMLGVRTDADKDATRESSFTVPTAEKVQLDAIHAKFRLGEPSLLTVQVGKRSVTVTGAIPDAAITRPLTAEYVSAQLTKFGSTEYAVTDKTCVDIDVAEGIITPASAINELRRRAVSALSGVRRSELPENAVPSRERIKRTEPILTAEFLRAAQITSHARNFFDRIYLPLSEYNSTMDGESPCGFVMPPVVYDRDEAHVSKMIADAAAAGAASCILSGTGQESLVHGYGLNIIAGHRYNVCSTETAIAAVDAGADIITASPEATAAQIRDMAARVPIAVTVYGRVPLMVTERCIIRAVAGDRCRCGERPVWLSDRRGVRFPMYKSGDCGTVICNSVPIWMGDKTDELTRLSCRAWHFMFTDEDAAAVDEIIDNFERGRMPHSDIRRVK